MFHDCTTNQFRKMFGGKSCAKCLPMLNGTSKSVKDEVAEVKKNRRVRKWIKKTWLCALNKFKMHINNNSSITWWNFNWSGGCRRQSIANKYQDGIHWRTSNTFFFHFNYITNRCMCVHTMCNMHCTSRYHCSISIIHYHYRIICCLFTNE